MKDAKEYVATLFKSHNISVPANRKALLEKFMQDEQNVATINGVIENGNELMSKWKLENSIADIMQKPARVLNATVGKPYETKFDIEKLGWKNITAFEFEGLKEVGLFYDEKTKQIMGTPTSSGDINVKFKFKVEGQAMLPRSMKKRYPYY
jgi:hypothetical protein